MKNTDRKRTADHFLYECGLLNELNKYGTPHIIGSYRMNLMAWNDLDIDIENDNMSLKKLHKLTSYIIDTFNPIWYEAKEEKTADGKTVWFHGFETEITGERWNFDLWFFDKKTIEIAEQYCDDIVKKIGNSQEKEDAITNIKEQLIKRGLYSYNQYTSIDVYNAVLDHNILTVDELLEKYGI